MDANGLPVAASPWWVVGCLVAGMLAVGDLGCQAPAKLGVSPASVPLSEMEATSPQLPPTADAHLARTESHEESTAFRLDLEMALRVASVSNPEINFARAQLIEALAGQLAARSLLLPNVNVGGNVRVHRGALQDDPGFIRIVNSQSAYLGAGSGAVGAGTIAVPGVWLVSELSEAFCEPVAASQRSGARRASIDSVTNSTLLDVAVAYLRLVGAQARLELLHESEAEVNEIMRVTKAFAKTGQGAQSDANRALAHVELVRSQMRDAEGAIDVAAARLCRLLSIDPTQRVRVLNHEIDQFRLVDENAPSESLRAIALSGRPELEAQSMIVLESRTRMKQERARPWLPFIAVGYSAGYFGGGSNLVPDSFGPLTGRSDFTAMAVWSIQNLGVGNRSRWARARAVSRQEESSFQFLVTQVGREVAEAQAACKASGQQVELARSALAASEEGYRLEFERIKRGQGRPIEVLDSFRQLLDARLELLTAIIGFDSAQVRLFVALGHNPESAPTLRDENAGRRIGASCAMSQPIRPYPLLRRPA